MWEHSACNEELGWSCPPQAPKGDACSPSRPGNGFLF